MMRHSLRTMLLLLRLPVPTFAFLILDPRGPGMVGRGMGGEGIGFGSRGAFGMASAAAVEWVGDVTPIVE